MSSKISIVVPVYGVESYICESIDTIINQRYTNIEIILVDDGSPDKCGEICDRYAQQDSRIRVIHTPNQGAAKAREMGVENSTGEYIIFVDPDDLLPLDAAERLLSHMDGEYDLVVGSYSKFYTSGKVKHIVAKPESLSQEEWTKRLLQEPKVEVGAPWGRIFRRSLFGRESFPNMRRTQDWLMNLEVSLHLKRIKIISDVVYRYRAPEQSRKLHRADFEYIKSLCAAAYSILERNGAATKYRKEYRLMQLSFVSGCIMKREVIDHNDVWVTEMVQELKHQPLSQDQRRVIESLQSIKSQKRLRRSRKRRELLRKILQKITHIKLSNRS